MSIVGILANGVFADTGGNIVGSQGLGSTLTHHFGASSIWAHPGLQSFSIQSDNVSTSRARALSSHSSPTQVGPTMLAASAYSRLNAPLSPTR